MAEIKVTGFVERILGAKGFKLTETHRRKNDAGEWENAGKTFFTVWSATLPAEGDRVTVVGKQKTVASEYQGQTRYDLVISADLVTVEKKPATDNLMPF
jgi:hypothetical protein